MTHAEAAKQIRQDLKRKFAGVKFSVRSRSFSQGCAVDVSYDDGPAYDAVRTVAEYYGSRGFDGSDDSTTFDHGDHAAITADGIVSKTFSGFVHVSRHLSNEAKVALNFRLDIEAWHDEQPRPYHYNKIDLRDLTTVRTQMETE